MPPNLERRLNVIDFATPVQTVETVSDGQNVRMVIESAGEWEHSAYQADTTFIVEIQALAKEDDELSRRRSKKGGYVPLGSSS